MAKRALRREFLARRRAIAPDERERAGARVSQRIAESEEFARADRVVLYVAIGGELPVRALAAAARAAGKVLLWPRVSELGEVEVAHAAEGELVRDAAGVLAPPVASPALALGRGDAIIVPGVAFARDGARLGRGGGHYDRLLARSADALSIGVAFDIQLTDELPTELHDRRVDIVATPDEMRRSGR